MPKVFKISPSISHGPFSFSFLLILLAAIKFVILQSKLWAHYWLLISKPCKISPSSLHSNSNFIYLSLILPPSCPQITDEGIKHLGCDIATDLKKLNTLNVDFSRLVLSSKFQKLNILLHSCRLITDDGLVYFVNKIDETLASLKNFSLNLSGYKNQFSSKNQPLQMSKNLRWRN